MDRCPNCAVSPRKSLLGVAGLVALAFSGCGSVVPVYGVPCTAKQLDGGANGCFGQCDTLLADGGAPASDPSNTCFDGGTP